jgi:hypothetical protein
LVASRPFDGGANTYPVWNPAVEIAGGKEKVMHRILRGAVMAGLVLSAALVCSVAEAHSKFSFSLGLWGPPPIYIGPRYCDYPAPVIYRRVYVVDPPPPVYVTPPPAPAVAPVPVPALSSRRSANDAVLVKIGELHADDEETREEAVQWLGQVRDPRAVRPLIEVMENDPEKDIREDAARALGYIGSPDAEPALQVASQSDPESDVRRAASKALSRIVKESTRETNREPTTAREPRRLFRR